VEDWKQDKAKIGAFDTETTGLHIIADKPFLFQFGWVDADKKIGRAWAVDLERQPKLARQVIDWWHKVAQRLDIYLGHNVKFDLHMLTNIDMPYPGKNLSDTMFFIRYGHDAVNEKKGGAPLKLKEYTARFIDREAHYHEGMLNREKANIAKQYNLALKAKLGKGWTIKRLEEFFKDKTNTVEDMLPEDAQAYREWLQSLHPDVRRNVHGKVESDDIPYHLLNRENVIRYALLDIKYTLLVYLQMAPIIVVRQNTIAIDIESRAIYPFFKMERQGFAVDRDYFAGAKQAVRTYLLQRRQHLNDLVGRPLSVGQHAAIKSLLDLRFGIKTDQTTEDRLNEILNELDGDSPAYDFITTIQELRTLEKWYSTYIIRFERMLERSERLYTTINQVGTVSGRVTSDFQQFPKDGIKDKDDNELFHPRKLVVISGGDYDGIVYIDYSQIELRLQAMYTILVGHPEPNLCRAYMPYNCVDKDGHLFDYTSPDDLRRWSEDWFLAEEPSKKWIPTDVHGETTKKAFDITEDDPQFKHLRSQGKKLNFAKNYGGQYNVTKKMFPKLPPEQIKKIDDAYYLAFPGVKAYHDYCYRLAEYQSYATNLFGVRYYNVTGHHLINMLVQGSGAFLLKLKIIAIDEYCETHQIKSKFQMNIHDELSWEKHKTEQLETFMVFKQMMETWEDTLVPIVANMDFTQTTWAEKKEIA
jgi:DNA polymerase-1